MNLKEMQQIELDLLKHFHAICEEYQLTYYLIGGSLLGAVRHQGFIPWDDDIDVGMPRNDYEKFCEIAVEALPNYMQFLNEKTENYNYLYGKLINTNTILREFSLGEYEDKIGVFIDIFPMDNLKKQKDFLSRKVGLLKGYYSLAVYKIHNRTGIKKLLETILRYFPYNIQKSKLKIRNYAIKYKDIQTDYMVNFFGIYKEREIMPYYYFGIPQLYLFEDEYFYGVEQADLFLTRLYGDYMKLPSKEKQMSHHEYTVAYKQGFNIENCMK